MLIIQPLPQPCDMPGTLKHVIFQPLNLCTHHTYKQQMNIKSHINKTNNKSQSQAITFNLVHPHDEKK